MLGITYYHQTIRKYVAVFGTLFNDINIVRKNSSGVITEQIKVPIAYEAKDKMFFIYGKCQQQMLVFRLLFRGWDLL